MKNLYHWGYFCAYHQYFRFCNHLHFDSFSVLNAHYFFQLIPVFSKVFPWVLLLTINSYQVFQILFWLVEIQSLRVKCYEFMCLWPVHRVTEWVVLEDTTGKHLGWLPCSSRGTPEHIGWCPGSFGISPVQETLQLLWSMCYTFLPLNIQFSVRLRVCKFIYFT